MKKLRLYDHNDKLWKEFDVYVDGQSFSWRSPEPTAVWLGTIALQDVEEEVLAVSEVNVEEEVAAGTLIRLRELSQEKADEILQEIRERQAGMEVESELEKTDNQGDGVERTGEAGQPESAEGLPEQNVRGKGTRRDRKPRKRKASEGTLGSGTERTLPGESTQ